MSSHIFKMAHMCNKIIHVRCNNIKNYGENLIDNVNSIMKFGLTLNVKKCWSPSLYSLYKPHRSQIDAIRIQSKIARGKSAHCVRQIWKKSLYQNEITVICDSWSPNKFAQSLYACLIQKEKNIYHRIVKRVSYIGKMVKRICMHWTLVAFVETKKKCEKSHNFLIERRIKEKKKKLVDIPKMNVHWP